MTAFRLEFVPFAARQYRRLDPAIQPRVLKALHAIADEPHYDKPLQGPYTPLRSYRAGDYRIVYRFNPPLKLVVVYAIGHRREVYRQRYS